MRKHASRAISRRDKMQYIKRIPALIRQTALLKNEVHRSLHVLRDDQRAAPGPQSEYSRSVVKPWQAALLSSLGERQWLLCSLADNHRRQFYVLFHPLNGEICISGKHCVSNFRVLLVEISIEMGERQRKEPIPLLLSVQELPDLQEPGAGARRHDRLMERVVRQDEIVSVPFLVFDRPVRGSDQSVSGGDHLRLPVDPAMLDRVPDAHRLDIAPDPCKVVQFIECQRRHAKPPLRLHDDEAFRRKAGEGFSYSARSHGQTGAHLLDPEFLARRKPAGQDLGS